MPTNVELEAIIRRLEARIQVLEEEHHHKMGDGMLNYVGRPITIKNGQFKEITSVSKQDR